MEDQGVPTQMTQPIPGAKRKRKSSKQNSKIKSMPTGIFNSLLLSTQLPCLNEPHCEITCITGLKRCTLSAPKHRLWVLFRIVQ